MTALAKPEVTRSDVVSQGPRDLAPHDDPFLAMIERAADRPDILDKLVDVRNAELRRRAEVAFWADFAQMQPSLPTIDRNGCIEIRKKDSAGERTGDVQQSSKYALWADILEACSPHMLQFGFGISFRQSTTPEGKILVTGILSHRDGHRETNSIALMHDSTGSKNAVQAVGSSLSYGMRYMGTMLLGIASKQGDDDGKAAGAPEEVSEDAVAAFVAKVDQHKASLPRLLKAVGAETIHGLTPKQFKDITAKFNNWLAEKEAANA